MHNRKDNWSDCANFGHCFCIQFALSNVLRYYIRGLYCGVFFGWSKGLQISYKALAWLHKIHFDTVFSSSIRRTLNFSGILSTFNCTLKLDNWLCSCCLFLIWEQSKIEELWGTSFQNENTHCSIFASFLSAHRCLLVRGHELKIWLPRSKCILL